MDLDRVKDHRSVAGREGHPEDAGAAAGQKQSHESAPSLGEQRTLESALPLPLGGVRESG